MFSRSDRVNQFERLIGEDPYHAADAMVAMEEKLEIAKKALEFYANPKSYMREPNHDIARALISDDMSEVSGFAKFCGGKHARLALERIEPNANPLQV